MVRVLERRLYNEGIVRACPDMGRAPHHVRARVRGPDSGRAHRHDREPMGVASRKPQCRVLVGAPFTKTTRWQAAFIVAL